ncbi:MAG: MBL fold metallo-hydrolase [Thaumarchaeota archaeon]|nr:MBL fold metallo-hydrolase [Nitrososphaerota archaeon]
MQKIADRVYCKMDPDGRTNVGLVDIGEQLVFIDTTLFPYTTREAVADAKATVDKPFKYLVNTHFHADHTYGNQEFSCPIVAHKDTAALMKAHLPGDLKRRIQMFQGEARKRLEEVRLTYPTMTFDGEMKLVDEPEISLIHLGGHTSDSAAVLLPKAGVVFAGDLLFVGYHPMLEDSDLDDWVKSLEKMKTFKARIIVPGHGSLTDTAGIQDMINYLRTFKDNLSALKRKGRGKKDLMENPALLSLPEKRRPERIAANIERFYDKL